MEFEPAMDVLLDPLMPCPVALINVPLPAPYVAQNMSDDELNDVREKSRLCVWHLGSNWIHISQKGGTCL